MNDHFIRPVMKSGVPGVVSKQKHDFHTNSRITHIFSNGSYMNSLTKRIGNAMIESALQNGICLHDTKTIVIIRDKSGQIVYANTGLDRPFDVRQQKTVQKTGNPAICIEKFTIDGTLTACLTIYFPVINNDDITGVGMIAIPVDSPVHLENGQAWFSMKDKGMADPKTGVWNSTSMLANLQKEIFKPERNGRNTTVVLMNIDNFAKITEEWGHFSGKVILAEFCQLIIKHLRSSDLFGQWGEREFLLLLPDTNLATGKQIAKRIGIAIEYKQFSQVGQITASLGVATHRKEESLEDFINRVDAAVFAAKTSGKKRVELKARHFMKLVWKQEYECGHEAIDEEHRQLFSCSNQLLHAIYDNKPKKQISPLINQLLTHIQTHFGNEEKIMASMGYPHTDEHACIHRQLVNQATHLARQFEENRLDFDEIFSFIANDVIIEHMQEEDRKFFLFFPECHI